MARLVDMQYPFVDENQSLLSLGCICFQFPVVYRVIKLGKLSVLSV